MPKKRVPKKSVPKKSVPKKMDMSDSSSEDIGLTESYERAPDKWKNKNTNRK
ncbi:MAG: hypothetical protein GY928_34565 [Colwellia sp.]|nr:hypothetical protein [Colwellia sp.]